MLKGACHEIFFLYIFHNSNPSGPPITGLEYFRIQFGFRRYIRMRNIFKKLSGVCIPPQSQTSRCSWVKLFTAESESNILLVSGCSERNNQVKSFYWWAHPLWGKKIPNIKSLGLVSLKFWFIGVKHTEESAFLNLLNEYLGEIET